MPYADDEAPSYRPQLDPDLPEAEIYYVPKSCSKRANTADDDDDDEDVGEDRISSLPNDIIHHIFSFMDMTEVVQTSILSNKWRYLWKTNPNLNFDSTLMEMYFDPSEEDDWDNDEFYRRKKYKFKLILNKVFTRLEKNHNINNLRLRSLFDLTSRDLKRWLDSALKENRHVKNLYINASVSSPLVLPTRLFNSELLTLKLVGDENYQCMEVPNSMFLAVGLRKIDLMYVKFPNGDASKELVLSCPVLEDLSLCECEMSHFEVFTIRAPLLQKLGLLSEEYLFCALNISCPNLRSLVCKGNLNKPWNLENLPALSEAVIRFKKDKKLEKELFYQYLGQVLKGICGVKTLDILPSVLQAITVSPEILEIMPNNFQSLRHIAVSESFGDMCMLSIPSVANILRILPCLEAFAWKRMDYLRGEYGDDDEEEEVPETDLPVECIFPGLKTVEVENFHGVEDEVKLLGFLLKSATSLEKMIITAITKDRTKLKDVSDKLLALPQASSSFIVVKVRERRKVEVFCTSKP